jgi:calcium-dependent protein kinase
MMDLILDGRAKYDAPIWETIDQSAKDFVCGLLVVNPQDRMTAEAASTHVWLSNREILPEETPSEEMLNEIEHCLLQYRNTSSMKKIALNFVAHQSTSKEVKQLRKVFTQLDQQRNGVLTFEEFKTSFMRVLHYSRQDIDDLFSSLVRIWR